MLRYILTIAICLLFTVAHAHEYAIQGQLVDQDEGRPLEGVQVVLMTLQKMTFSDALGRYQFDQLDRGTYQLCFKTPGYQQDTIIVDLAENKTEKVVNRLLISPLELPELTITANKPQELTRVSGLDLQLRNMSSSQDALQVVPGLFIAQHAGGGKAEQIFLRGFDLDHGTDLQIAVDGTPVNMVSHAHGQGYSDLHFLIPELIEQVVFEKGPHQAEKGNFATAGAVDFKTKVRLDKSLVKLEGGQFGTFRGVGLFDIPLSKNKRNSAYIATEYVGTEGYFESPQDFQRMNVLGKYNGFIGEKMLLTATASTFWSRWNASGQIPVRAIESGLITRWGAIDDTEGGEVSRSQVNLQLTQTLPNKGTIRSQLYYIRAGFELYSNFTFFLEDSVNSDQIRQKEMRDILGAAVTYTQPHKLLNLNAVTTTGLRLRHDAVQDNELSHTLKRTEVLERLMLGDVNETHIGAFAQEALELGNRWNLTAGFRVDHFQFGYLDQLEPNPQNKRLQRTLVSPKLNLSFQPSKQWQLFAKAGTGFHSNDSRAIISRQNEEVVPRGYGTDLGVKFRPTKRLFMQATLWGLKMDQELVYVGDAGIVEASGETRRLGVEWSIRWQMSKYLWLDGDVNYTDAKARDAASGENYLPLAPSLSSTGGLTFKGEGQPWSVSLRYRYLGDRPANEDYSLTAEGYLLCDLVTSYQWRQFEVGVSVQNIFNTEWREAQFETTSRLRGEVEPVTEIHFTPGTPFFARAHVAVRF